MRENKTSKIRTDIMVIENAGLKPNYSAIARKYNLDYRTVKKVCSQDYGGKKKTRNKQSKLDAYESIIKEKILIPRVTLKGVFNFLVTTYGVEKVGTYSNFKCYCKKRGYTKQLRNNNAGATRYETDKGDMAQCDRKEDITLTSRNGEKYTINVFHLLLKYSRYSYLQLTISKDRENVFGCLINAFKAFGGVPKRILFDNMSTIVDTSVKPKRINNQAKAFAKDFNFEIVTCKARHAYTKGSNEARNKVLDWIRVFDNEFNEFDDLIAYVADINKKMNFEICQGTSLPPYTLFSKEKEYSLPLARDEIVDLYLKPHQYKVNTQQLVTFKGNMYSLDKSLIGKQIAIEEVDNILYFYYNGKLVEVHNVSKKKVNYTAKHHLQTFEGKVKAETIEKYAESNLKMMDKILEERDSFPSLLQNFKTVEETISYFLMRPEMAKVLKQLLYKLDETETNGILEKLHRLAQFVKNEKEFFWYLCETLTEQTYKGIDLLIWVVHSIGDYDFLTSEGLDYIRNLNALKINELIKKGAV